MKRGRAWPSAAWIVAVVALATASCGSKTDLAEGTEAGCNPVGDSGACIELELSTGDRACEQVADCTFAPETGRVCFNSCSCPGQGVPVSRAAAARFESQLMCAMLPELACSGGCPEPTQELACLNGQCTTEMLH
jgi:hypothetical protein